MSKVTINIIGTCTSRDIFGITSKDGDDPESYKIQSYIWNVSPLYLFEKNISIDDLTFLKYLEKYKIEKKSRIHNFCARRFLYSLKKNIFERINFDNCDFLILDNFFCRLNYFELEDKTIITISDEEFLNYLIINNVVPKIKRKFCFEDIPIYDREEMIQKFCLVIRQHIDERKIILIEYRPSNILFNSIYNHYRTFFSISDYKKQIEKFKWTASILKENLKNANHICPPAVTIGDQNHKWGQHLLHYLPEYYHNYYIPIIDIYTKNNKISEADIKNIKSDFDNNIIEKYGKEIQKFKTDNFNKLFSDNKAYEIFSFHKSKIFFNIEDKSIIHSKIADPQFYTIFAKIHQEKIMFYILVKNKIFYINEITFYAKANLSETQVWLNSIVYNDDRTISLKLYDKYLSFRANGQSCLMQWNRTWEHISLKEI